MTIKINGTNTTAQPSITGPDTDTGLVYGTNEVSIVTGGTEKVKVDSSGSLLVGTTSTYDGEASNLIVASASNTGITVASTGNNNRCNLYFADGTSSSNAYVGGFTYDHANDSLLTRTNGAERMRILSDGTIATGGLTATPATVAAGSYIQHAANAGFFGNNGDAKFGSSANNPVLFQVNGSEKARIDSSGNVGIGTTSPAFTEGSGLHIAGSSGALKLQNTTNSNWAYVEYADESNTTKFIQGYRDANGIYGIRPGASLSSTSGISLDSSGRVAIGTTSALTGSTLTVAGNALAVTGQNTAHSANSIRIGEEGSGLAQIRCYGPDASTNGSLTLRVSRSDGSNSQDVTIDSSGRLLVGATASTEPCRLFATSTTSTAGPALVLQNTDGGATSYNIAAFYRGSTGVGTISTTNSATAYNTSSDYRLKENVVDIADGITRVKQLAPKRFNFIADADTTVDGFIAHEAQTIVPEAVTGQKDATREEEYVVTPAVEEVVDEEGTVTTAAADAVMGTRTVPDHQGIDQSKLVPLLTAALQEAIAKIETLETQNASFEARLTALEGGAS